MSSSEHSLETVDQRVSYGIAMNMGASIARQGGVEIDLAAFVVGLQDGLAGARPRVAEADLRAAFETAQERAEAVAAAASAKQREEGRDFLAQNKARPGVVTTASGLQYEVLAEGKGPRPTRRSRCITTAR